jgi:hypothetical protein
MKVQGYQKSGIHFLKHILNKLIVLKNEPEQLGSRVTDYWLGSWGSVHYRGNNFSLCHHLYASPGTGPASYLVGTKDFFSGSKATEHKANHSPLSNDVVKNIWSVTSTVLYMFMAW